MTTSVILIFTNKELLHDVFEIIFRDVKYVF